LGTPLENLIPKSSNGFGCWESALWHWAPTSWQWVLAFGDER